MGLPVNAGDTKGAGEKFSAVEISPDVKTILPVRPKTDATAELNVPLVKVKPLPIVEMSSGAALETIPWTNAVVASVVELSVASGVGAVGTPVKAGE